MQDILTVVNLSKRYGSRQAVAALNFHICQGEIFGLLGPNGAGKTTTIGMLTGLVDPSGGQVMIDGLDLRQSPLEAKAKIGFVPQDFAFYPTLSARDNLYFLAEFMDFTAGSCGSGLLTPFRWLNSPIEPNTPYRPFPTE